MQRMLWVMLFCITVSYSSAQYTLSGVVQSDKNEKLAGANVVIGKSNFGKSTQSDGSFSFSGLKKGKYLLQVSFVGYQAYSQEVNVDGDKQLSIVLQPQKVITDEVIVSAIRAGNKTPIAKTNVSGNELKELNAADDVPLLLNLTPSVVSTTESGIGVGYSSMRVRGTDASRVNVTVNGIPLNDPESQGVFWVNMPNFSSSVEDVQIQRGVGTSTNGAAAFGATVNFNTIGYSSQPSAEISSTAGSFNTFKNSINATTGLIKDKYSFQVSYSDVQSDGYVKHAFSDHKSLYISGAAQLKNGLVKANIIHGNQRTGISWWGITEEQMEADRRYNPAGVYYDADGNEQYYEDQTDNYIQTHYQLFYSANLNSKLHLNMAAFYVRGDGYYEQYKEDESFSDYGWDDVVVGDEVINQTDLIRQKKMANDFYGITASLNYASGNIDFTLGGGWNEYDGDHFGDVIWARYAGDSEKGDRWYFNDATKTDFNIYGKLNYQLTSKLNAYVDLQYRSIDYKMSGKDDDLIDFNQQHNYDFFNPKLGVYYELNHRNHIYSSYSIAHREPTRANFKDAKGDVNATPKDERLNDFELGYQYKSPLAAANINMYYMKYKDQLVPTGAKSDVGYDIMTNVDDSYRLGVELDLGVRINSFLRWDGNTTLSSNKIKEFVETATVILDENWNSKDSLIYHENSDIAYSPSVIANSIFTVEPFKGNSIKIITKYVGEQYFDNTESDINKLDDYLVWNATVTQQFRPSWMKLIEWQFTVNNIFNLMYSSNAYSWGANYFMNGEMGSYNYYYPQAGTHFFTRLRFVF